MQSENYLDPELESVSAPADRTSSNKTNIFILVHAITFLAGLGLLVVVIWRIGYQNLLDSLTSVGWGFLTIVALNLTRHFLRAASMYRAVHPDHRGFKYRSAVAARFGGEAVNFFTR